MRTHASPDPLGPPDPFTPLDVRPDDLHPLGRCGAAVPAGARSGSPDRRAALPTSAPLVTARRRTFRSPAPMRCVWSCSEPTGRMRRSPEPEWWVPRSPEPVGRLCGWSGAASRRPEAVTASTSSRSAAAYARRGRGSRSAGSASRCAASATGSASVAHRRTYGSTTRAPRSGSRSSRCARIGRRAARAASRVTASTGNASGSAVSRTAAARRSESRVPRQTRMSGHPRGDPAGVVPAQRGGHGGGADPAADARDDRCSHRGHQALSGAESGSATGANPGRDRSAGGRARSRPGLGGASVVVGPRSVGPRHPGSIGDASILVGRGLLAGVDHQPAVLPHDGHDQPDPVRRAALPSAPDRCRCRGRHPRDLAVGLGFGFVGRAVAHGPVGRDAHPDVHQHPVVPVRADRTGQGELRPLPARPVPAEQRRIAGGGGQMAGQDPAAPPGIVFVPRQVVRGEGTGEGRCLPRIQRRTPPGGGAAAGPAPTRPGRDRRGSAGTRTGRWAGRRQRTAQSGDRRRTGSRSGRGRLRIGCRDRPAARAGWPGRDRAPTRRAPRSRHRSCRAGRRRARARAWAEEAEGRHGDHQERLWSGMAVLRSRARGTGARAGGGRGGAGSRRGPSPARAAGIGPRRRLRR